MIELGYQNGLSHIDTIKCSQELDELLNIYRKNMTEKNKKHYLLYINRKRNELLKFEKKKIMAQN